MDAQWEILPRCDTFPGVFELSATFLGVGGQRDAAMLGRHSAPLKFAKGALAGA